MHNDSSTHLGSIEARSMDVKPRFPTHVIDVKLEVTSIHDGEYKTQCILCFICICQAHLLYNRKTVTVNSV